MGNATAPAGYSPAVPISVYRELANELKTTQATLDALTQQNHQLLRQNKLLRTEIHRFVQAAEQLGHFAGVMPPEPLPVPTERRLAGPPPEAAPQAEFFAPGVPVPEVSAHHPTTMPAPPAPPEETPAPPERKLVPPHSAIVPHPKAKKRDRPKPMPHDPPQRRLFTEQPEGMRPLSQVANRADLGNLWLATTILLVVVSAFGAGFLIMRPLLNR
ncbi:MAG TPA: hypothetical protein V6D02_06815 [Candidatus Obscuribacterales bacterium]